MYTDWVAQMCMGCDSLFFRVRYIMYVFVYVTGLHPV